MFHFLGFIFIIIIAILLIGLSIIGTVVRKIFGLNGGRTSSQFGSNGRGSGNYQSGGYSYNNSNGQNTGKGQTEEEKIPPRYKKLFSKDEGEYVDFEEIKD